jgi:phosphate-selective porin OprO/OprP
MSYRVELEFSGTEGGRIRDAWIGWDDLLLLDTLRLGNQKRPYGLEELNSSNFMVFMERPFVVEAFNENNRRFGIASYGMSDDLTYNWRYGVFGLDLVQDTGSSFNERLQPEVAGRLSSTWWYDESSSGRGYGHWGISGVCAFPDGQAPNDGNSDNTAWFRTRPEAPTQNRWLDTGRIAGAEAYQILGLESVLNLGRVQVAGEFMNLWLQRSANAGQDIFLHGGYVYISYFITGEHLPWNRELGILGRLQPLENFFLVPTCEDGVGCGRGAWQVALRLSYADLSDADILGGVGQSATFAVNWYWNSHSRVQGNYTFGRIDDRLAPLDDGSWAVTAGDYQIAGLRFMMDF